MPWDYILTGASGAGIALILVMLFAQEFIRQGVDSRFRQRAEMLRSEIEKSLARERSELDVWAELRQDILAEIWRANRDIVRAMTALILKTQELARRKKFALLKKPIDAYRQAVHGNIDLLSPRAVELCQEFLETAHRIKSRKQAANDANPLKALRREFYQHLAQEFGLEKMMPWMAKQPSTH